MAPRDELLRVTLIGTAVQILHRSHAGVIHHRSDALLNSPAKDGRALAEGSASMVGLGGLEPPTSPLSGVRSNHLSYRPGLVAD